MDLKAQLLLIAELYGEHTKRSRARISTLVFNQGMRLDRYADGSLSPSVKVYERAMQWFSTNWPSEVEWPVQVSRPKAPEALAPDVGAPAMAGVQ